ncbi:MAG: chemotaxis protein CheV [Granulosicoccaceae bacterium]
MDQEDTDALLRSGNNELQALVFNVADQQFGVNVAKLDELIMPPKTRTWPGQHDAILGAFHLRTENMALVDLGYYIKPELGRTEDGNTVIVTSFNNSKIAFLVNSVDQILRVDWGMVGPPAGSTGHNGVITGIMKYQEKLIPMLDFEAIHDDIAGVSRLSTVDVDVCNATDRSHVRVTVIEDSQYMSAVIQDFLNKAGFNQIEMFGNGKDAFDSLQKREGDSIPGLVISDIEMPQMDGLTMTRKLKEIPKYRRIPFVLFSSIITKELLHKGERAGADAQLNKGDVDQLIPTIDRLLFGQPESTDIAEENTAPRHAA